MTPRPAAWHRFMAILAKEFIHMRRDRATFALMVGIPILQLIIFGYAINANPKHLPAVVVAADHGPLIRTLTVAMNNTAYFDFIPGHPTEAEARRMLELGTAQFVLHIPEHFSRDLVRGDRPALLLEADATDPAAMSNAFAAMNALVTGGVWRRDLQGGANMTASGAPSPADLRIQAKYNPEAQTQYNIVPGLMGVVLTMTLVMITGMAVTRERELGTMESLLATPARPLEVMLGKIVPYILVGYVQVLLILVMARLLFGVPLNGSVALLLAAVFFFIVANLTVGILFSTLAKTQLQAVQMTFFFFLPSLLLSGFMFPFRGMPPWAQHLGSCLPMTHFLRIVRGIMLKGNGLLETADHLWPIVLFTAVVVTLGSRLYKTTLD